MLPEIFSFRSSLLFAIAAAFTFAACSGETETVPAEDQAAQEQTYEVRGFFVEVDDAGQIITILHEEIPEVMRSMQMRMILENAADAENLERGDMVSFTMVRIGNSWYVRNVQPLPEDTELEIADELKERARI
ncbi:MAG: copper-binding protein [Balneolales bacterium]|nr:copper-binding protein [Balneolales bacterium]